VGDHAGPEAEADEASHSGRHVRVTAEGLEEDEAAGEAFQAPCWLAPLSTGGKRFRPLENIPLRREEET